MKKIFTLSLLITISLAQEECLNGRYHSEIFDNVVVTSGIQYGSNYNSGFLGDVLENLYLDVYEPDGDVVNDRPLVIMMFGGSFIGGSRTSPDIVELCTRYAKMGYVAAAIDYRLTTELIWLANEETAYKAAAKGIHDLKGAIRYFRMNDAVYDDFRIDVNRIYAGGVSAGGISAVNAAYLDEDYEIPTFIQDYIYDNGGLEGVSGNEGYSSEFHGVVNLCGAVGETDWIIQGDMPIVNLHGTEDDIVPYGDGMITLFGLNMNIAGSESIHNRMLELGNLSSFLSWDGAGHTPFISSSSYMDETVEFSSSFLSELACESDYILGDINGDAIINVLDIIMLVNLILDGESPSPVSDINNDNTLNVLDIISLVNIILDR